MYMQVGTDNEKSSLQNKNVDCTIACSQEEVCYQARRHCQGRTTVRMETTSGFKWALFVQNCPSMNCPEIRHNSVIACHYYNDIY